MGKSILHNHDLGTLILRLFVGLRLIYGVVDNVFSWKHMQDFETFLAAYNFPFPLASAIISVYAQLIAGVMIVVGFQIRIAALLMTINFMVALIMVHRTDSIEGMTPAAAMLFGSLSLLFTGSGRYAVKAE